jgi:hypothetical protein
MEKQKQTYSHGNACIECEQPLRGDFPRFERCELCELAFEQAMEASAKRIADHEEFKNEFLRLKK